MQGNVQIKKGISTAVVKSNSNNDSGPLSGRRNLNVLGKLVNDQLSTPFVNVERPPDTLYVVIGGRSDHLFTGVVLFIR